MDEETSGIDDPVVSRQDRLRARLLATATPVLTAVAVAFGLAYAAAGATVIAAIMVGGAAGAGLVHRVLLRRGYVSLSTHVLGVGYSALLVGVCWRQGGVDPYTLPFLSLIPVFMALALGRRASLMWALVVSLLVVSLFAAQLAGYAFPVDVARPRFIELGGLLGFIGILLILAHGFGILAASGRRALVEANEALSAAKTAAEDALRVKTEFLANISHEIRTPLNGVIGMTEVLLDGELDPRHRETAEVIASCATNLLALINDVLDFSKMEAGRLTLEAVPVALRPHLESAAAVFRVEAARKGVELRVDVDPALPEYVLTDPTRLRQIVLNLMGNAVKFTARGHVQLSARAAEHEGQRRISILVIDTGIGIAAEHLTRLFTAFSQTDASTTRRYGGTGLGLAIVRQVAEAFGGTARVASTPGVGSTFAVELPLVEARASIAPTTPAEPTTPSTPAVAPPPVPPARVDGGPSEPVILVAEDNALNQLVVVRLLERCGHVCDVARNGREAIEAVRRKPYRLVLMDCQMPEMDGYEATRAIRASGASPHIVALTANAIEGDRERCLAAGMDGYLTKPVTTLALREALASAGLGQAPTERKGTPATS